MSSERSSFCTAVENKLLNFCNDNSSKNNKDMNSEQRVVLATNNDPPVSTNSDNKQDNTIEEIDSAENMNVLVNLPSSNHLTILSTWNQTEPVSTRVDYNNATLSSTCSKQAINTPFL